VTIGDLVADGEVCNVPADIRHPSALGSSPGGEPWVDGQEDSDEVYKSQHGGR
jgi:hypothetical protein